MNIVSSEQLVVWRGRIEFMYKKIDVIYKKIKEKS